MARAFVSASSTYLSNANAPVSATPLTLSIWINPTIFADKTMAGIVNSASNGVNQFKLELRSTGAVRCAQVDATAAGNATTTATITTGTWHHVCGVFTSNASRTIYLDGGSNVTNTTSLSTPTGLNTTGIGSRRDQIPTYVDAVLAEFAIWNVVLNVNEITALSRGILPTFVQPSALVAYWPVWGLQSPEIDLTSNNRLMTVNNSPAAANHAPVTSFSRSLYVPDLPEPSAVASVSPPLFFRPFRQFAGR